MTRDEAIEKFRYAANEGSFATEAWIDRFAALGMIKLDDAPRSISSRFTDIYLREGCANGTSSKQFQKELAAAGLKLVEA